MDTSPVEEAVAVIYVMSCTPLICSSNGWITDFIQVLASAPVYDVDTSTVGGAIFGYCSTGKVFRQIKPIIMMTIAIEIAITFLSMKIFFILFRYNVITS